MNFSTDLPKGWFTLSSECQCCDVASDIDLVKLLKFLIIEVSDPKNGLRRQSIRYDTSIDTDAPNQSLTLSVNKLCVNEVFDAQYRPFAKDF